MATATRTEMVMKACDHVAFLMEVGTDHWFLDSGYIVNMDTGVGMRKPVLRRLKEGRDGRLVVTRPGWLEEKHCPVCGEEIRYEQSGTDGTHTR